MPFAIGAYLLWGVFPAFFPLLLPATPLEIYQVLRAAQPHALCQSLAVHAAWEPVTSGRQWVIDPIDGTKNYVRGVPVWATLISLLEDGEPVVSVVSAPALRRRWYASKGAGAFRVW